MNIFWKTPHAWIQQHLTYWPILVAILNSQLFPIRKKCQVSGLWGAKIVSSSNISPPQTKVKNWTVATNSRLQPMRALVLVGYFLEKVRWNPTKVSLELWNEQPNLLFLVGCDSCETWFPHVSKDNSVMKETCKRRIRKDTKGSMCQYRISSNSFAMSRPPLNHELATQIALLHINRISRFHENSQNKSDPTALTLMEHFPPILQSANFANSKLIPSVCQRVSPLAAEHELYNVLWDTLGTRRNGTHPAAWPPSELWSLMCFV